MARAEQLAFAATRITTKDAQTNALATATMAAPGLGFRNYCTGIVISANSTPAAAVVANLTDGAAIDLDFYIPDATFAAFVIPFSRPIECAENAALALTLPALGAAVTGGVAILGFVGSV